MALETEIKEICPFCKTGTIIILEKASYTSFKKARGSGVTNSFQVSVKGDFRVGSGCSECGKTKQEIQRKIYGSTYS